MRKKKKRPRTPLDATGAEIPDLTTSCVPRKQLAKRACEYESYDCPRFVTFLLFLLEAASQRDRAALEQTLRFLLFYPQDKVSRDAQDRTLFQVLLHIVQAGQEGILRNKPQTGKYLPRIGVELC